MCSVTFIPQPDGFLLGMNRDESLQRRAADPPRVVKCGARTALFPSEPATKRRQTPRSRAVPALSSPGTTVGSWIGVNDTGLCVALINWYGIESQRRCDSRSPSHGPGRPGSLVSRGVAVPALLGAAGFEEASDAITRLPLRTMSPFRLLVFSLRERIAHEFRWDQSTLSEVEHPWKMQHWFSSGFDEPGAQQTRGRTARRSADEPDAGTLPWLRRLHASHAPVIGPFSICMHRADAATVSYTEVVAEGRCITMHYHDGPPCCAPRPTGTGKISLRAACKESLAIPTNQQTGHAHENQQPPLQPPRRSVLPRSVSRRRESCIITR